MNRSRLFLLSVLAAGLLLLGGCGGGSSSSPTTPSSSSSSATTAKPLAGGRTAPTHAKLGVGHEVRDCDITFDGPGPPDWRRYSRWIGPFGLAGPGPGPDFDRGAREGGLLTVKTPTMVAGHRPVTISVPAALRYRVGILGVHPRPAYASITYVPCDDKRRTVFPAGLLLRDRRPLTILVQVGDGPVRGLYLKG